MPEFFSFGYIGSKRYMENPMSIVLLSFVAWAGTLAGVSFPDSKIVQGQSIPLHGMGLREKFWVDIYVAALYFPEKTKSSAKVISADVPKQLDIQFIYSDVPKSKMLKTLDENLKANPQISKTAQQQMRKCYTWFQDFTTGDTVSFIYKPNTGTSMVINGKTKGTIPGKDFMTAVFTIYLGPKPASLQLKKGLLNL